jgi:hypothetical protein
LLNFILSKTYESSKEPTNVTNNTKNNNKIPLLSKERIVCSIGSLLKNVKNGEKTTMARLFLPR